MFNIVKSAKKGKTLAVVIIGILVMSTGLSFAGNKEQIEESGIRKESVEEETTVTPSHGEYLKSEPGKSKKIERSFENSPPLIPHDLTGMLPIAETGNMCLGCHMPDEAARSGATAIPRSHLIDLETGEDLHGKLDGKRYNCMQCHVPQVEIPAPVKNTFKSEFRNKKGKVSSNLSDILNEGVPAE